MSNITRKWMEPTFVNPEGSILRTPSSEHSYKRVDPSHRWPTGGISDLIHLKRIDGRERTTEAGIQQREPGSTMRNGPSLIIHAARTVGVAISSRLFPSSP